ncbi:MAG: hypothetical protein V3T31_02145 [candidate division Zixibacteria bacterium]
MRTILIFMLLLCQVKEEHLPVHSLEDILKLVAPIRGAHARQDLSQIRSGYFDYQFRVECKFEELPTLSIPARTELQIYAIREIHDDTELYIKADSGSELLSDSILSWPGPKSVGDSFGTTVELICRQPGSHGFSVTSRARTYLPSWSIGWRLDPDGELADSWGSFKPLLSGVSYATSRLNVFSSDSLEITGLLEVAFERIHVAPIPRIADTSTVVLTFGSPRSSPDGVDIEIRTQHIVLASKPAVIDRAVSRGETLEISFDIVPTAACNVQSFEVLLFYRPAGSTKNGERLEIIEVSAIFEDDGSLRRISEKSLQYIEQQQSPETFPIAADDGHHSYSTIRVTKKIEQK